MSYEVLVIYPKQRGLIPDRDALARGLVLLADMTHAEEVEARETEHIEFLDAGENAGAIACGLCGAKVEPTWWVERMRASAASRFVDTAIDMACCGARLTLDALHYGLNEGFARFRLTARAPKRPLSTAMESELASALGGAVSVILARY